jgi:hypothetical protein
MMMPANPYPGINAHLNSLLQTPGADDQPALWHTFHQSHIAHLCDYLNQQLPENYIAFFEQSLQMRTGDGGGMIRLRRPEPDISIFRQANAGTSASSAQIAAPTYEAMIVEVLEPLRPPNSITIREIAEQRHPGKLVTWIELLSPSNKPGGSDYPAYASKRVETIQSGVPFIEIDYLHESPSPVRELPAYPGDMRAYPYYVAIHDSRPTWQEGKFAAYGFHTAEPLPVIPVPLAENQQLAFDLNPVYQHTFTTGRWHQFIEYSMLPVRFETYRDDDQARIQTVMQQHLR